MRNHGLNWRTLAPIGAVVVAIALVASGCGDSNSTSEQASSAGNSADAAFASAMIPHHEGAIAMAEAAKEQSKRPEIKEMADAIISAQEDEIKQLQQIERQLTAAGVKAPSGGMGMSSAQMGMNHSMPMLENAKEFDRAFIDMMIPHHRGAIVMAQRQIKNGDNDQLTALSKAVIAAQTKEIAQMQAWRKAWFGSELKSAAADSPSAESMGHGSMEHGSMGH